MQLTSVCLRYIDSSSTSYYNPKIQVSSHLLWFYSLVCVGPGRSGETTKTGFLATQLRVALSLIPSIKELIKIATKFDNQIANSPKKEIKENIVHIIVPFQTLCCLFISEIDSRLQTHSSHIMRKPVFLFLKPGTTQTRQQAVQPQKMAIDLKFRIKKLGKIILSKQ